MDIKVMSEGHMYNLNSCEKVLLINLFFRSNSILSYVVSRMMRKT